MIRFLDYTIKRIVYPMDIASINIETFRTFVALGQVRHFTQTAKVLRIPQSKVSRTIRQLEEALGVVLVLRSKRGIQLTDAGQRLIDHVRNMLRIVDEAEADIRELHDAPRGIVSLGSIPSVSAWVVPELTVELRSTHPLIQIRQHEDTSPELSRRLVAGAIDLAVVVGPSTHHSLKQGLLWQEDYAAMVPHRHVLTTRRGAVTFRDLVKEPIAMQPSHLITHALNDAAQKERVEVNVTLETDNLETLRRMVELELAVAIVPRTVAERAAHWAAQDIAIEASPIRRVILMHRGDSTLSAAARIVRKRIMAAAVARPLRVHEKTALPSTRRHKSPQLR